jgi:hypothetical protein
MNAAAFGSLQAIISKHNIYEASSLSALRNCWQNVHSSMIWYFIERLCCMRNANDWFRIKVYLLGHIIDAGGALNQSKAFAWHN